MTLQQKILLRLLMATAIKITINNVSRVFAQRAYDLAEKRGY